MPPSNSEPSLWVGGFMRIAKGNLLTKTATRICFHFVQLLLLSRRRETDFFFFGVSGRNTGRKKQYW